MPEQFFATVVLSIHLLRQQSEISHRQPLSRGLLYAPHSHVYWLEYATLQFGNQLYYVCVHETMQRFDGHEKVISEYLAHAKRKVR
jgi:hypothetical protein